jgi:hypothetical protein
LPFQVLGNIGGYELWKQQPVRRLTPRINKTIEIFSLSIRMNSLKVCPAKDTLYYLNEIYPEKYLC